MKYEVIRQHQGDKFYLPGDERDASETDVAHLVKSGVLKAKAHGKPKHTHEGPAAKTKGE